MPTTAEPLEAVHVDCQWLPELSQDGNRQLEINGTPYEYVPLSPGHRLAYTDPKGRLKVYDIDPSPSWGWQCDCPDATFRPERPGGCKHVQALLRLLSVDN